MKPSLLYEITVKELQRTMKDRILDVYTEKNCTVVVIPNGRLKIMNKGKQPQPGYSLRNGGRKTYYEPKFKKEDKK
jgi:hypothetical protein